jgi:hypothetical protein
MSVAEHTFFLGLYDYEWSAVGSIATAAAAAIALLLPFLLDLRGRMAERRRDRQLARQIIDAAYLGLAELGDLLSAWCDKDARALQDHVAWGIGVAKRLDIYAQKPGLSDDILDVCVATGSALTIVIEAASEDLMTVLNQHQTRELHTAKLMGVHARTQLGHISPTYGARSLNCEAAEEAMGAAIDKMRRIPLDRRIEAEF